MLDFYRLIFLHFYSMAFFIWTENSIFVSNKKFFNNKSITGTKNHDGYNTSRALYYTFDMKITIYYMHFSTQLGSSACIFLHSQVLPHVFYYTFCFDRVQISTQNDFNACISLHKVLSTCFFLHIFANF